MWARTLEGVDGRFRLVITRRPRRQGRARTVEVVEARFWLVLARLHVGWLSMVQRIRQASKPRVEKRNKSGRQAAIFYNGRGDINSGVVHICKAADTAAHVHYHCYYSACMTQTSTIAPQHSRNAKCPPPCHAQAKMQRCATRARVSVVCKTLKQPICRSKACLLL